jgi:hypothetical protein
LSILALFTEQEEIAMLSVITSSWAVVNLYFMRRSYAGFLVMYSAVASKSS